MGKTARRSATLDPSSPTSAYLYYDSESTTETYEKEEEEPRTEQFPTTEFDFDSTVTDDVSSSISSLSTDEWLTDDTAISSPIAQAQTQFIR